MASHTDWMHFYRHNDNNDGLSPDNNPTAVTTTVSSTATATATAGGRVAKPVRKRSRASRRTPTTLLNTDTTNFRAMVQQFTGGPTFGSGSMIATAGAAAAFGGTGGYQLQFQQAHYPHQMQQQNQHQRNNNIMYSAAGGGGGHGDLMIGNNSNNGNSSGNRDGYVMGTGVRMEAQGPGPSGGSNVNAGYMF